MWSLAAAGESALASRFQLVGYIRTHIFPGHSFLTAISDSSRFACILHFIGVARARLPIVRVAAFREIRVLHMYENVRVVAVT